jgi:hypothetical protein
MILGSLVAGTLPFNRLQYVYQPSQTCYKIPPLQTHFCHPAFNLGNLPLNRLRKGHAQRGPLPHGVTRRRGESWPVSRSRAPPHLRFIRAPVTEPSLRASRCELVIEFCSLPPQQRNTGSFAFASILKLLQFLRWCPPLHDTQPHPRWCQAEAWLTLINDSWRLWITRELVTKILPPAADHIEGGLCVKIRSGTG